MDKRKDKSKRKYRVSGLMTISMHIDVEADSPEEAKQLAQDAPVVALCHQCANGEPGEWNTSGELDGEVQIADDEEPIELE